MINNMQTWKKDTAPISKPYSGWDYFLPKRDYSTKAHKAGRCSRHRKFKPQRHLLRCWALVLLKFCKILCHGCPRYKITQGINSQGCSWSHKFSLSLEISGLFFSTAFLILEMEQTFILWRWVFTPEDKLKYHFSFGEWLF